MSRFLDIEIGDKKLPPIGAYWQHSLLPLEQALQPVSSLFDQLDRSIKEAKRHCFYPTKHQLTQDESAAVLLYTMEGGDNSLYHVLNAKLRSENRRAVQPWFGFLKLFDTALSKLPTVQECVWRGVQGDISQQFKKDQLLTWWSITSCSMSVDVVQDFLGSGEDATLLMIEAKGAKNISGYTNFPDEQEVLLPPGTELIVKGNALHHKGGLHVVHLAEVSEGHVAQLSNAMASMDLVSKSKNKSTSSSGAKSKYEDAAPSFQPKPVVVEATASSSSVAWKPPTTMASKTKAQYEVKPTLQEFASPGTYKPLYCRGRPCANCGKCRDWYYTGDEATWRWIQNYRNWSNEERRRWNNGDFYKGFKRRDGATCYGYYLYDVCLCEDNYKR